jgi:hypothetical protein
VAVEPVEGEMVTWLPLKKNPKFTVEIMEIIEIINLLVHTSRVIMKLTNVYIEGLVNTGISSTG